MANPRSEAVDENLTEMQIQNRIVKWARETYPVECEWLHSIDNGADKSLAARANAKRAGLLAGIADLFLPYPFPCGKPIRYGLYIEIKRGTKGRLSPEQRRFGDYAIGEGYWWECVRSVEEGKEVIRDYLTPLVHDVSSS